MSSSSSSSGLRPVGLIVIALCVIGCIVGASVGGSALNGDYPITSISKDTIKYLLALSPIAALLSLIAGMTRSRLICVLAVGIVYYVSQQTVPLARNLNILKEHAVFDSLEERAEKLESGLIIQLFCNAFALIVAVLLDLKERNFKDSSKLKIIAGVSATLLGDFLLFVAFIIFCDNSANHPEYVGSRYGLVLIPVVLMLIIMSLLALAESCAEPIWVGATLILGVVAAVQWTNLAIVSSDDDGDDHHVYDALCLAATGASFVICGIMILNPTTEETVKALRNPLI